MSGIKKNKQCKFYHNWPINVQNLAHKYHLLWYWEISVATVTIIIVHKNDIRINENY